MKGTEKLFRKNLFVVLVIATALVAQASLAAPSGSESASGGSSAPEDSFRITYPPQPKPPLETIPPRGIGENFRLVGHNPLLDDDLIPGLTPMGIPRGGNGNLGAAAGPCVYVGSLTGSIPALVVDVSNPRNPTVVGPVPGHVPGIGHGIDQIDTIPDLNLMVIHKRPAVVGSFNPENATDLQIYDISDCRNPRLVMNFPLGQEQGLNNSLHMSTIWRDPERPERVLSVQSFLAVHHTGDPLVRPDGIDFRVTDLTGCPEECDPKVVAEWGLEEELGIPPLVTIKYPDGTRFPRPMVGHQATLSVDGTRMWVAQLGAGFFALDSELLAKDQPCNRESPTVGESEEEVAEHCLKLLNPVFVEEITRRGVNLQGRADWDPPFFSGHVHTAANVPEGPYVVVADEAATTPHNACPWSWMRVMYTGNKEQGLPIFHDAEVPYRGDLFPRELGTMASAENIPGNCPTPGVPEGPDTYGPEITRDDHGPHEPLVFPDLVIATYYSSGLRAYSIANPLMPAEVGFFYGKPVDTIRFCWVNCLDPVVDEEGRTVEHRPDPSFGPVDVRPFSRPLVKDGLIYYVDANNGLYIVRYRGPHADQIPGEGVCVTGNIVDAGFEPCAPYTHYSYE